ATDCWLNCSAPGGLGVEGVGDRAGCVTAGDFDGRTPVPCCLAAVPHATSVTMASETARMRWSTGPKATTGGALRRLQQFPWDLEDPRVPSPGATGREGQGR